MKAATWVCINLFKRFSVQFVIVIEDTVVNGKEYGLIARDENRLVFFWFSHHINISLPSYNITNIYI